MTEQTFGGYASDETAAPRPDVAVSRPVARAEDSYVPDVRIVDDRTEEISLLEELEAELNAETDRIRRFEVVARPGWVLEFNAIVSASQIKRYNDQAKGKGKAENADARISNGMALIEANTGILRQRGDELVRLTDEDGKDLRLNSTRWLQMMKEPTTNANAVRALCKFMEDSGVITMGAAVLREAGWAEDLTPLDPTDG